MPVKPILNTIRTAFLVPREKVNYGWTQGLEPPYVSVLDYEASQEYDTSGAQLRNSSWKVVIVHKTVEDAEDLADLVNDLLDTSETVTPECMRCFQESYRVGQMEEKLYQWGVEIGFSMVEDLRRTVGS